MADVARALVGLGQTIRQGKKDVWDRETQAEAIARSEADKEYDRAQREELMALQRPTMELQAEQSRLGLKDLQAEQERLNAPVTLPRIFADKETPEGRKMSGRALEQVMWKRPPKPGEPESQKILKTPMYEAAGKILGAKYANEGPNRGFYVKKDGTRVTERDLEQHADELEALALGRSAQGRMIRSMKEKARDKLVNKEISPEQYQAEMTQIISYENNPVQRITELENKINFLGRFKNKESKAAIERAKKSIRKQYDILAKQDPAAAEQWAAGPGGRFLFEKSTGRVRQLPGWAQKDTEKELSPSQQIKQIELNNLNTIFDATATPEQKKQAAMNLQTVRGDNPRAHALRIVFSDPMSWSLSQEDLMSRIDLAERTLTQKKASRMGGEEPPPLDESTPEKIRANFLRGDYGDPADKTLKKQIGAKIDALKARQVKQ